MINGRARHGMEFCWILFNIKWNGMTQIQQNIINDDDDDDDDDDKHVNIIATFSLLLFIRIAMIEMT